MWWLCGSGACLVTWSDQIDGTDTLNELTAGAQPMASRGGVVVYVRHRENISWRREKARRHELKASRRWSVLSAGKS